MLPPIYTTLRASSAVLALVANRIYRHGKAPQGVVKPYVTWFLVVGTPDNTLSETPAVDRCTVQIDCWSESDTQVETLAKAVRDAVEPFAYITAFPVDDQEAATNLYRIAIQLDWWLGR